jgi:hypothetical protein
VQRRQIGWFGYGLAITVVAAFTTSGWLLHLLSLALPIGIGVAVVRWRLYGIEAIVDRTLVGAVLVGMAAVCTPPSSAGRARCSGSRGAVPGFVGAVAVALVFAPGPAPGRGRRRPDAARAAGRPVRPAHRRRASLQGSRSPRAALQQVTREVREALRLPAVELRVDLPGGGRSSSGPATPTARCRTRSTCAGTASRSACWRWRRGRGRTSSSRATGGCSTTWPVSWRRWRTPCG